MSAKVVHYFPIIGCALSASDGSSPQVYVRLLAVEHRLECYISSIASPWINAACLAVVSTPKGTVERKQNVLTPLALGDVEDNADTFAERLIDVVGPQPV